MSDVEKLLLIIGACFIVAGLVVLLGGKIPRISREARRHNRPRHWLFVNAYGPQQSRTPEPITFHEAMAFLKEHIGCSFIRVDFENSIIFFDGRKLAGQS